MATRPVIVGVIAILAFALGAYLARDMLPAERTPPELARGTVFREPRPLPDVALTDQDGNRLDSEAMRSHWTLVFFGFTQCPDVCPTTLATLAQARRKLSDLPPQQQPRVLLVSVDPERDDPERLRSYVRFFDPEFLGATGTADQVAAAAAAFGVPYAKVPLPGGDYTMDHGSGVFVVGPPGLVAYSSGPQDATELASDYRKIVAYSRGRP
jgi:protein SCO1/2